jgi:hypothetical protein|nr:MAG TPA: hypothetical protein [Caudoviricetes sp.]
MKYRNVKTGIEIEVLSECGGDWVLVEEPKKRGGGRKGGKKDTAEKVDESGESAESAESADSSEDVKESDE